MITFCRNENFIEKDERERRMMEKGEICIRLPH